MLLLLDLLLRCNFLLPLLLQHCRIKRLHVCHMLLLLLTVCTQDLHQLWVLLLYVPCGVVAHSRQRL
jgi:hypothetical protein